MSVNEKMTAIADKIRALLGISDTMGLDAMANNLVAEQTNVSAAFTAIGNKGGTVPPSKVSGNLASAIGTIPTGSGGSSNPVLQSKSVSPSEDAQTVYPDIDQGYVGLSSVNVEAISSTYVGSGVPRKTAATITPSKSVQTAVEAGTYASGDIKVGAIPDSYIIPSGTKAITQNGTHDVAAYKSVSVNVAASGTTVQRKSGSFTTDSNGAATVNCGFRPDVLLITGLYDSNYKCEYHAACVFPEQKNSSYDLTMAATTTNFPDGIEFYPERTTNGFTIEVWGNNVLLGDWYEMADMTFSYVAIKYT